MSTVSASTSAAANPYLAAVQQAQQQDLAMLLGTSGASPASSLGDILSLSPESQAALAQEQDDAAPATGSSGSGATSGADLLAGSGSLDAYTALGESLKGRSASQLLAGLMGTAGDGGFTPAVSPQIQSLLASHGLQLPAGMDSGTSAPGGLPAV